MSNLPKNNYETSLHQLALDLYNAEEQRILYKKTKWQVNIAAAVPFLGAIIAAWLIPPASMAIKIIIPIFLLLISFMLFGILGDLTNKQKKKLRHFLKATIIPPLLQTLFPGFKLDPEKTLHKNTIAGSTRFQRFKSIGVYKGEDLISGYINNMHVELSEVDINGNLEYQQYDFNNKLIITQKTIKAFKGLMMVVNTYAEKDAVQTAIFSTPMQLHFNEIQSRWKSGPRYTVLDNGDVIFELDIRKLPFLEFSEKDKMYDLNFTESLYFELYLMLRCAEILKEELDKK